MNNPITGQYNQQPTASATPTSSAESLLNPHAEEFIPGKPQHNGRYVRDILPTSHNVLSIRAISLNDKATPFILGNSQHNCRSVGTIHTTSSLSYNERPFTRSESSPFNNVSVQVTQEEQRHNPWLNPVGGADNYAGHQYAGTFLQHQQQNSWQTNAECEDSDRHHQQFLHDAVITNLQNPSPNFANKTRQKNSTTDKQVNTFIQKINNLHDSDNKDISKQVSACFNYFKKEASYLTDDHRKQLLSIIPTIGKIIDKKNLDHISTVTILYSLSKTEFFYKMNPNYTSENECIRYEQESINLIDKILTKILQIHEKHSERAWSNIFYALGLLAEQSPNLITSEQINNLMANLNIQKQSLTEFKLQDISNIFVAIIKLLKFNKLDSSSIATHSFLTYLLQQVKHAIGDFNTQDIAHTLLSIDKLANFSDFIQLISDKQDIIELLLDEAITNKNLNWKPRDVSQVIYTLGMIIKDIYLNKKVTNIVKEAYHTLYSKVPVMVEKIDILSASFLLSGIIKLITNNTITSNKPSKSLIRGIFLEKIIADTSIINNNYLYHYLNTMANFQAYLTKNELIKILENINFFIPDINYTNAYFTTMGYLLAKIRKEIANDKKNRKLIALEHLIETEIKKTWLHFKPNIDSFNMGLINAIHNTCSLIYKAEDLTLLKATYEVTQGSNLEKSILPIIKTLIADPESLKIEYSVNSNLPPVDACIIQPDGSMLAIEIQGTGHYLDDEGEYPTGKHLLKSARLQIENIQVIEVNGSKLINYHNPKDLASPLINILLENNVKIRPEYCNNIPKLVRDSGFTSK